MDPPVLVVVGLILLVAAVLVAGGIWGATMKRRETPKKPGTAARQIIEGIDKEERRE